MGVAQPQAVIRDRYRLDELIGEGGMATVWRAWDLTLQRAIAVKLLFQSESHTTEALVERFLREARIAASVQHRNVIHIVDFGTTPEGQPFMVMELLEGETLAARLRRQKPLPVADVLQIGHLTLRGLAAVHAAGIVHRDLKPENVYLRDENGVMYPKILDFGISRSIDAASGPRTTFATRDGVIVGTPEYMSPEQARGVKQLSYRTDLYSMGVVLYEALTGQLPYTSENVGDLIVKIVTGCAPPVHELMPSVPRAVSDVVARAMARSPSDRFADATEMQEALLAARQSLEAPQGMAMLSDLPPDAAPPAQPRWIDTSPSAAVALPRTQAVQLQMLAPAHALASRPFATTNSVKVALNTQPTRVPESHVDAEGDMLEAAPVLLEAAPAPLLSARVENQAAPDTTVPLRHVRAPDTEPPAGDPTEDDASVPSQPVLTTASHAQTEDADAALPAEAAASTEGAAAAPQGTRHPKWLLPAAAATLLLGAAGVLAAWHAPSATTPRGRVEAHVQPSPPKPQPALDPAPEPPAPALPAPALPTTSRLTLTGVPKDATVTLDGQPADAELVIPYGDQAHQVAVSAPGKQTWNLSYVPNTDQTLAVALVDAPKTRRVSPTKAAPAKRKVHKRTKRRPQVLRVPDF